MLHLPILYTISIDCQQQIAHNVIVYAIYYDIFYLKKVKKVLDMHNNNVYYMYKDKKNQTKEVITMAETRVRNIPDEDWLRFKITAMKNNVTVNELIITIIKDWLKENDESR